MSSTLTNLFEPLYNTENKACGDVSPEFGVDQPYRTFSNHCTYRNIGKFHMSSGRFNASEPVQTTVQQRTGEFHKSSVDSTLLNLLEPLYFRGNKSYREISRVLGVSTLPTLFKPLYITGNQACGGVSHEFGMVQPY